MGYSYSVTYLFSDVTKTECSSRPLQGMLSQVNQDPRLSTISPPALRAYVEEE